MKAIVLGCAVSLMAAVWAEPDLDAYNWRDGRTLTVEGRGFTRTVGPYGRLPLNRVDDLPMSVAGRWGMREHTTGVNVRFIPHASKICLRWRVVDPRAVDAFMGPTAMTGLDVYGWRPNEGWRFAANPRYFFNGDGKFCGTYELDWESGRPCMVYLPLRSDVLLFEVGVPKGATVEPMAPHGAKRRIVHYGTSIVHGGCCSRPGMALTCQEGRLCDLDVVNLGFSGGGRMELVMAKMIAEIDAALYVVDCDWNMSVDLQKQNYEPFVRELKKLRPNTPILLCGGCTQRTEPRDQEKFARGVYEKLKSEDAATWSNLHFLGGVEMLPKDDECTFDYCHPNDYGFMFMAKVYAAKIKSILAEKAIFDDCRSVFISDVHVRADSYQLERFARIVDEILAMSPLPRNVVCFGDVAHLRGPVEDYRASRPQFQRLVDAGIKVTFGMGNHDRRGNFLSVWPEYRKRMLMDDFIVSEADLGACDLLMLDTLHEPDNPDAVKLGWIGDGQFKERRLAWLKIEMARRPRPFFLAAHHPIREITDGDWKSVNDLVMNTPNCLGWIHGHDHAWKKGLIRRADCAWGDNIFKRWLCLPSTGLWGDIGYAVVQSRKGELRVDYRAMDHYFPSPETRTAMDDDLVSEKRGGFMTFRW